MTYIKILLQLFAFILPWKLRRHFLNIFWGYKIDPKAKIGFSIILAKQLIMDSYSEIGNFTICKPIDLLHICNYGILGNFVTITGYPTNLKDHYAHITNRKCTLIIGDHSAITNRHYIDCTAGVNIGNFTTIAGIRSQILTHSIDLLLNRQNAIPIEIGHYCFVGTDCVLLPGAKLPDFSILSAKSLLNKHLEETDCLYGGVPVIKIKNLQRNEIEYFNRIVGFVN